SIEQVSEYGSNIGAKMATGYGSEGTDMTIDMTHIDTLGRVGFGDGRRLPASVPARPVRGRPRGGVQRQRSVRRPGPGRAPGTPLRYRGTGVLMSRASHRR